MNQKPFDQADAIPKISRSTLFDLVSNMGRSIQKCGIPLFSKARSFTGDNDRLFGLLCSQTALLMDEIVGRMKGAISGSILS